MELPDNDNTFGIRLTEKGFIIGNTPISIDNQSLTIDNETFHFSHGLKTLLLKSKPADYAPNDLITYKNILTRTNAHKTDFKPNSRISCSRSWKYTNIISKLFPSKRVRKRKQKCIEKSSLEPEDKEVEIQNSVSMSPVKFRRNHNYLSTKEQEKIQIEFDDVNELIDRLMKLDASQEAGNGNHMNEIMSILEELEELGVIVFNK